jgi:hypothetical protein
LFVFIQCLVGEVIDGVGFALPGEVLSPVCPNERCSYPHLTGI